MSYQGGKSLTNGFSSFHADENSTETRSRSSTSGCLSLTLSTLSCRCLLRMPSPCLRSWPANLELLPKILRTTTILSQMILSVTLMATSAGRNSIPAKPSETRRKSRSTLTSRASYGTISASHLLKQRPITLRIYPSSTTTQLLISWRASGLPL